MPRPTKPPVRQPELRSRIKAVEKHKYRPRKLCQGNSEYERLMAEAKAEYDALIKKHAGQSKIRINHPPSRDKANHLL